MLLGILLAHYLSISHESYTVVSTIDLEKSVSSVDLLAKTTAEHDHVHSIHLLEIGVNSHSLLIGFTLGSMGFNGFTELIIAISFHQFFEGLAISSLLGPSSIPKYLKIAACILQLI